MQYSQTCNNSYTWIQSASVSPMIILTLLRQFILYRHALFRMQTSPNFSQPNPPSLTLTWPCTFLLTLLEWTIEWWYANSPTGCVAQSQTRWVRDTLYTPDCHPWLSTLMSCHLSIHLVPNCNAWIHAVVEPCPLLQSSLYKVTIKGELSPPSQLVPWLKLQLEHT